MRKIACLQAIFSDQVYYIHSGNVICHSVANTLLWAVIWLQCLSGPLHWWFALLSGAITTEFGKIEGQESIITTGEAWCEDSSELAGTEETSPLQIAGSHLCLNLSLNGLSTVFFPVVDRYKRLKSTESAVQCLKIQLKWHQQKGKMCCLIKARPLQSLQQDWL